MRLQGAGEAFGNAALFWAGGSLPNASQIPGRKARSALLHIRLYPHTGQGGLQHQSQDRAPTPRSEASSGRALLLALDLLLSPSLGFIVGLHDPSLLQLCPPLPGLPGSTE